MATYTSQEVREEIRTLIGDDDDTNLTFSDIQLNNFLKVALKRLTNSVGLGITLTSGGFSTAPSDGQADLIILQASCLISQRQFREAAKKGVKVRQDENEIDTAAGLGGFATSAGGAHSFCQMLVGALQQYRETGNVSITSATSENATNTWAGNSNLYEDVTFNGDGSARVWHLGAGRRRTSNDADDLGHPGGDRTAG